MHCYGIIALAEILITPDLMEQFLRAHHFSLLPAQNLQDRKFCRCQGKRFFIQCAFMCPDIQHKAGMLQNICICFITGVVPLIPAELGLHSCHQLQRPEWLCDIIVSSEAQAGDLIQFLPLCGQHDHRKCVCFPDLSAYFQTAHTGKHNIQQGQVYLFPFNTGHCLLCCIIFIDLIILIFQIKRYQISNLFLVIHYQYLFCHF